MPRVGATTTDGWQADVQQLWNDGHRQKAINQLLERINAQAPRRPREMGLQFGYYLWQLNDFKAAEAVLRQLRADHPNDPEVVENLGVMLGRNHRYREAIVCFEQAAALRPTSANAWDGLANAYQAVGDLERARQAGERSLALKTEAAKPLRGWSLPPTTPKAFLATRAKRHVVAFSLWGSNPRYLRGALRNLLLIPELYPAWTARVYLDNSVPPDFIETARQLGAQVALMPAGQTLRQRLCWRFLVANDPGVGRFLVRDTDSVVNLRERHAVEEWLASDQWFHVMRDWWTHSDPILAGMWGGVAGVLPDLATLLKAYQPPAKETANVDQWFLRDVLWASIRHHALIHDRCFRSEGGREWPDPTPQGNYHVGQDEFTANRQRQAALLKGWVATHPWLQMAEDMESKTNNHPKAVPQGVRQLDLRTLRCRWISMERNSPASRQLEQKLRDQGFQDLGWCPGVRAEGSGVSLERLHARGVALAHKSAIVSHLDDQPLLLLEDDVEMEGDPDWLLTIPADADAVWIGISRYGSPKANPVDQRLSKVELMFSTHGILYLSMRFKQHTLRCIDQSNSCLLPFDIALAFTQQNFNTYAVNCPPIYQGEGKGAHNFEKLTRGHLITNNSYAGLGTRCKSTG